MIIKSFEINARSHFQKSEFVKTANGTIEFDLDWGVVGTNGALTSGAFRETKMEAHEFFNSVNWAANTELSNLYKKSKTLPNGPIYKCIISFKNGQPNFKYHFEKDPIQSLDDIVKNSHGTYPLFAYRQYFTEDLIEASEAGFLRIGHQALIEYLLPRDINVPEHHMEFYALNDFISDFYNGGLNQYFARPISWDTAKYNRTELYPRVSAALTTLGREDVSSMFEEAIALYAHIHDHVETGRKTMDIPAVPKQEQSDIAFRFWNIIDDLEKETEGYIKANKSKFAYN